MLYMFILRGRSISYGTKQNRWSFRSCVNWYLFDQQISRLPSVDPRYTKEIKKERKFCVGRPALVFLSSFTCLTSEMPGYRTSRLARVFFVSSFAGTRSWLEGTSLFFSISKTCLRRCHIRRHSAHCSTTCRKVIWIIDWEWITWVGVSQPISLEVYNWVISEN